MSRLSSILNRGRGGQDKFSQTAAMTTVYLLEMNAKFEGYMQERVDELERRVAMQQARKSGDNAGNDGREEEGDFVEPEAVVSEPFIVPGPSLLKTDLSSGSAAAPPPLPVPEPESTESDAALLEGADEDTGPTEAAEVEEDVPEVEEPAVSGAVLLGGVSEDTSPSEAAEVEEDASEVEEPAVSGAALLGGVDENAGPTEAAEVEEDTPEVEPASSSTVSVLGADAFHAILEKKAAGGTSSLLGGHSRVDKKLLRPDMETRPAGQLLGGHSNVEEQDEEEPDSVEEEDEEELEEWDTVLDSTNGPKNEWA